MTESDLLHDYGGNGPFVEASWFTPSKNLQRPPERETRGDSYYGRSGTFATRYTV